MLYCLNKDKVEKIVGAKTAGKKAPDDITELTCRMGGQRISFMQDDSSIKLSFLRKIRNIYYSFKDWHDLYKIIRKDDIVVIQHPYEGIQAGVKYIPKLQNKGAKIICLIHDIRALRDSIDESSGILIKNQSDNAEIQLLGLCDYIIAHNSSMKKYFVDNLKLNSDRIYELGIFDYICSPGERIIKFDGSIAVAGNLSISKCGYLYKLLNDNVISNTFHLYGPNFTLESENAIYHGVASPNELPQIMEGSFGLVWDGDEIDRCGGVAGEYLKYNNPHKCSLYLAAGMPVIIWRKAALASFVIEHKCGIVVDSLKDVSETVRSISPQQYNYYLENTDRVKKKLIVGANYKSVVTRIITENHLT